jgi:hypothetical protein
MGVWTASFDLIFFYRYFETYFEQAREYKFHNFWTHKSKFMEKQFFKEKSWLGGQVLEPMR